MRLLVHLAGDIPHLPAAEFRAVFESHGVPFTTLREEAQFLDGHTEASYDDVGPVLSRLGLSHVVAMHLFDGTPGAWSEGSRDCCFPTGVPFAVRYVRIDPDAPWRGPEVDGEVGELLRPDRPVDLKHPSLLARTFLLRDRVYVGQQLWESDPKERRGRHVENRPHFSPVSLEPRLARALVNLTRTRPGEVVFDPFCGTGGILLEAAHLGMRAMGSDLDPEMAKGARANLAHFGLRGQVFRCDVGDVAARLHEVEVELVDAVVTDLPYGRSSSTHKEPIREVYERGFDAVRRILKPGSRAVLGLPDAESAQRAARDGLEMVDVYKVRAHKSLTRHFALLRRT